jgi:integrase
MAIIDKKITFTPMLGVELNSYVRNNGTTAIKIRAQKGSEYKSFNTKIYILPSQWKNGQVFKHPNATEYNQTIREHLNRLESFCLEQLKKYGKVSLNSLERGDNKDDDLTFTAFFKRQINANKYHKDTKKGHQTTLNKLNDCFKRELAFIEMDYKTLKTFENYLIGQDLHPNTLHKRFKNIKTHLNEAIRYNYIDVNKNPFLNFKVKREKTYKEALTENELILLEQWTAEPKHADLELIRDFFLIACYTGLRFSDVSRLSINNFYDTPEGLILSIETKKTNKPYKINTRILFRAKGSEESKLEQLCKVYIEQFKGLYNVPFLGFTNKQINDGLKEIFSQVPGLNPNLIDKITSHYARHTFTSIMSRYVPAPTLQYLLQHSSLAVTQGYINLSQSDINRVMQAVFIG